MKSIILALLCFSSILEGKTYQVAFYSDFEPISYSESRDPANPQFNSPQGYEIDLLHAITAIPGSDMSFKFHGIKEWNNIWLSPYTNPEIDIALGGITREDRRLLNDKGNQVLANTHGTAQFKQSLLVSAKDANRIKTHKDLTCGYIVGAVRGTTGEYRFLTQTGITNDLDKGLMQKGMVVVLEDKSLIKSDGSLSIYDPKVANRSMLIPPDCSLPITKYFVAEDSMIPALEAGYINAIARGEIGNRLVADKSGGKFAITAIYSLECPKQESIQCSTQEEAVFYVKKEDKELLEKLNRYIDYLTDKGSIGYNTWKSNKNIFLERAKNAPKDF